MKVLGILACLVVGITGTETHLEQDLGARALPTVCGSNEVVKTANFDIRNYWVDGSQGTQCTTVVWSSESTVSWSAKWSWPSKSTSLVSSSMGHLRIPGSVRISSFDSIPTSWLWSYQYTKNIKASVVYDIVGFSDGNLGGNWNLQIWLGTYGGLKPLGSKFGTARLSDVTFDVFADETFGWKTHTFVARSPQNDFTGDLLDFFDWTVDYLGIGKDWFIYSIRGGTNAYQGVGATFSSPSFTIAPSYKVIPTSSAPPTPSQTAIPGCSPQWAQCGGNGWAGPTCCQPGNSCIYLNEWHSQCLLD